MIDWHSHVLPAMDDGSQTIEESLAMLAALKDQGVDIVIATPHFYANEGTVDGFLERRKAAFDLLQSGRKEMSPAVLCGAEVRYYPGISKWQDLGRLTIEGTRILLLEMPMSKWTDYTLGELSELANTKGLKVMMAHIERYLSIQEHGVVQKLRERGLLIQVNASFFEGFVGKRKALRMLGDGLIQFIGSDCHNLTSRAPKLRGAYELISKKYGEDYICQMNEYAHRILGYHK